MGVLKNIFWWLAIIAILVHLFVERQLEHSLPFIDNYLDPMAGTAVLLGAGLMERRKLLGTRDTRFSALDTAIYVFIFFLIGEFLFPWLSDAFHRDYWDLVSYILGGAYFYFLINR